MSPWFLAYFASLVASGGLAWVLVIVAKRLAFFFGVLDRPSGGRKDHPEPIPLTGGWAIYAAFALIGSAGFLGPQLAPMIPELLDPLGHYLENLRGMRGQLGAVLVGTSWIFAVGAIDDVRPLGPRFKLLAQILAVAPLILGGISVHVFLPFPFLGWIVTVGWVVLLMNSFNFNDNMDGLCATIAGVIACVLAIGAYQGGELVLPILFLSFAGIMLGFLIHNFHPASIFLGDSGSLVVGYLMAVFSIMTTFYKGGEDSTGLPVLIPLAVMGVPLFDTASVMWIRWRKGVSLMVGDRNHFSHRLLSMGFTVRQTAVTIGMLTAATGLLALSLRHLALAEALLHLLGIVMLFGVIAALEFVGRNRT